MDVLYLYDRDFMLDDLWSLFKKFTNDNRKPNNTNLCNYNSQSKSEKRLKSFIEISLFSLFGD